MKKTHIGKNGQVLNYSSREDYLKACSEKARLEQLKASSKTHKVKKVAGETAKFIIFTPLMLIVGAIVIAIFLFIAGLVVLSPGAALHGGGMP